MSLEKITEAYKLIDEVARDPEMFLKLIELGQLENIGDIRDKLEQVSTAIGDDIFYSIAHRIEQVEEEEVDQFDQSDTDEQSSACMAHMSTWDDSTLREYWPYYWVIHSSLVDQANAVVLKKDDNGKVIASKSPVRPMKLDVGEPLDFTSMKNELWTVLNSQFEKYIDSGVIYMPKHRNSDS